MARRKGIIKFVSIILIFVLAVGIAGGFGYKLFLKWQYPLKETELVEKYATEYNIDKNLLYALIKTESGFDRSAESNAGAIGLTQITEETFMWLLTKTGEDRKFEDLYDPEVSIKYGALFISMLLDEFGDVSTSIAAYHAGRGRVDSWLKNSEFSDDGKVLNNIPISDTSHYVYKVTKAMNMYANLYDSQS